MLVAIVAVSEYPQWRLARVRPPEAEVWSKEARHRSVARNNPPYTSLIPRSNSPLRYDLHFLPIPILHTSLRSQINMDTQAPKSTHL